VKRLFRILFNAVTALSLVLLIGTLALWLRNRREDAVQRLGGSGQIFCIQSYGRSLLVQVVRPEQPFDHYVRLSKINPPGTWRRGFAQDEQWTLYYPIRNEDGQDIQPGFLGFAGGKTFSLWGHQRGWYPHASPSRFVLVPYWFLTLLTALLPTVATARFLRRRRYGAGFCRCCGYDMRATPARCPECGTVPT
jgi:hypothetical protein